MDIFRLLADRDAKCLHPLPLASLLHIMLQCIIMEIPQRSAAVSLKRTVVWLSLLHIGPTLLPELQQLSHRPVSWPTVIVLNSSSEMKKKKKDETFCSVKMFFSELRVRLLSIFDLFVISCVANDYQSCPETETLFYFYFSSWLAAFWRSKMPLFEHSCWRRRL